ncbi:protein SOB FIVE-LIKE 5 isoform X2 [Hordeum vulgare subsp. vulgare]|uniref:protein SOB FIVE-LIKE 5 isoform X2 n=1 Tax=Hordeum vulgare subsp. vulgare TaxID=112509 RepID=UPI000B46D16E|nr:protein SOB FIVE-LIKE 5 isoform X2 [Hordeum vulgare subsp. vulgare]
MTGEDAVMAAAASSECSSGCQSGWTTYLEDDSSSYSRGHARLHLHAKGRSSCHSEEAEEEDDLSMISDASSGPRQLQYSPGSDQGAAALAKAQRAERRRRTAEPAAARRQGKTASAAASTLLEDTASSPAFFNYSNVMGSPEANVYGGAAGSAMEFSNTPDFSSTFFSTTGFESPLSGSPLGSYLQVQYSPAPTKPMPTRQGCRDGGDKIGRW